MTEAKYKNERKTKDRTIHEPQSLCREVDHTETAEIPALERAEAKIRSLNKELEQRVAERTSELQSANEALRENEKRLRLVIDNLPVLISYVDKSGRYRFNNKTYLDWFGLPPDRVLDREVPEILGDAAYEVCEPYIVEALAGKTVSYEARLAYAHGESRHVHCAHVPDFDRDGTVKGFFSIVSDITERKRTEEALRQAHDELERRVEERTAELRRANEALTKEIAERARTERALRKSEERLHRSVLDAPIPIMMHAEGGEVLMISKRWAGLSGYSHADIPTILDWTEKAYGANKERVRDRIRRLCEIEEPFEHEAYVTTAQGERRTWDFRTAPLGRLPDGRRFVISMAVDITERKRTEAALRESEARLSAFIDHSPATISIKNRDGRFIVVNPAYARLVGMSREEVLGKTSHDLFGKIDKAHSDSMVAHDKVVLDEGRVVQSEVTLELEDGVRTLHMNKFPIRDATGTIVAIGTEAVDITARKAAEQALRESEARYQAVVEDQTELISRHTPDGNRTFVNEAYCRYLGKSRDELIGRSVYEALALEDLDRLKALYASLTPEQPIGEFEISFPGPDGETVWQRWTKRAIFDASGCVTEFQAVGTDITERKRAQEALQESEDRYKRLVETTNVIPWEVDLSTWRFTYVGPQAVPLLGYALDDWYGAGFWPNSIHPDDRDEAVAFCQASSARGEDHDFEYRMLTADGDVVWMRDVVTVVSDEHGPKTLRGIMIDITEQKQAQVALYEREAQLRAIMDSAPVEIYLKDREGRYVRINRRYEELWGVEDEAVRGKLPGDIHHQENFVKSIRARDLAVLQDGRTIEQEDDVLFEDGVHTLHVIKFPIRDPDGNISGLGAIATDVTERKRVQEALSDSEARLRAVIDTVVDGVILMDPAGMVQIFNQACERLFGYKADEVIGQNVKMLMPPPYRDEHDGYIRKYQQTGERRIICIGREVVGWRKDGSTMPLEISVGEMNQGGTHAFVGIMRDVSDRKLLERQRLHAEKMEALGVLASGIAHEFNNMLFAMIGLTESVRNTLPEGNEERTDLEGVLEAGERAQDLVRQILAFSRQDEAHPHPVDLQHVLTGAIRLVRATLPATIAIRQNLDKISRPVLVDPTHVHQIFLNLAANAAHAMKENGGLLDVRLDQVIADDRLIAQLPELAPGPYARLTVRDTGCGMDNRILGRIFDPFFTTKEVGVGTGMGLAAVHGVVESYSGAIDVSSRLGRGTTFEIYLPLWAGEDKEDLPGDATGPEDLAGVGA